MGKQAELWLLEVLTGGAVELPPCQPTTTVWRLALDTQHDGIRASGTGSWCQAINSSERWPRHRGLVTHQKFWVALNSGAGHYWSLVWKLFGSSWPTPTTDSSLRASPGLLVVLQVMMEVCPAHPLCTALWLLFFPLETGCLVLLLSPLEVRNWVSERVRGWAALIWDHDPRLQLVKSMGISSKLPPALLYILFWDPPPPSLIDLFSILSVIEPFTNQLIAHTRCDWSTKFTGFYCLRSHSAGPSLVGRMFFPAALKQQLHALGWHGRGTTAASHPCWPLTVAWAPVPSLVVGSKVAPTLCHLRCPQAPQREVSPVSQSCCWSIISTIHFQGCLIFPYWSSVPVKILNCLYSPSPILLIKVGKRMRKTVARFEEVFLIFLCFLEVREKQRQFPVTINPRLGVWGVFWRTGQVLYPMQGGWCIV